MRLKTQILRRVTHPFLFRQSLPQFLHRRSYSSITDFSQSSKTFLFDHWRTIVGAGTIFGTGMLANHFRSTYYHSKLQQPEAPLSPRAAVIELAKQGDVALAKSESKTAEQYYREAFSIIPAPILQHKIGDALNSQLRELIGRKINEIPYTLLSSDPTVSALKDRTIEAYTQFINSKQNKYDLFLGVNPSIELRHRRGNESLCFIYVLQGNMRKFLLVRMRF